MPKPNKTHSRIAPSCRSALLGASLCLALAPGLARGGGFEFPANGTEALGRGGAFTAKADSPLALEYNVSGLARQRGTQLLFDSNLHFGSYSFQRADSGGVSYPLVQDMASKPFYAPFIGLTTDFGYFDRWTFAIGGFGPSSIGKRSYPTSKDNPGPGRFDVVSTDTLLLLPTVAAAVRVNQYFDLGLGLQLAFGTFELSNVAVLAAKCAAGKVLQDPTCEYRTDISAKSSVNPLLQIGVLVHPHRSVDVGFQVRSAANFGAKPIAADGVLRVTDPNGNPLNDEDALPRATFSTSLPWVFRLGVRYAYLKAGREVLDLELDALYEAWSLTEGVGSHLDAENPLNPGGGTPLSLTLSHYYKDTYGLRLGGAYNQPAGPARLTFRLGLLYDSSATESGDTRIDFNTLPKVGATAGLGVRVRGVTLNLAYAYLHSFDRTVTDGRLLAIDAGNGMAVSSAPAVNDGLYRGENHIVSLGLQVLFEELVRGDAWARRPRR